MSGHGIEETLAERHTTHGDYFDHARIAQNLKDMMRQEDGWLKLNPEQREALEMIAHKIARALAGDPWHRDHWHDIAGYATLVANRCAAVGGGTPK